MYRITKPAGTVVMFSDETSLINFIREQAVIKINQATTTDYYDDVPPKTLIIRPRDIEFDINWIIDKLEIIE